MKLNKTVVGMLCTVSVGALLCACGDEVTNVYQTGIAVLDAGKKLDKCTDENVGEMVFVTDSSKVFYCADGEWLVLNGKDGADGKPGENGSVGKPGEDGSAGSEGVGCSVEAIENGYKILCGGDSVGVVLNGKDGESVESSDTVYSAFCGAKKYDVSKQFCHVITLYDLCGGEAYEPSTHFCSSKNTVIPKCGGLGYDITTEVCDEELSKVVTARKCNGVLYNDRIEVCDDDVVVVMDDCGSKKYNANRDLCHKDVVYSKTRHSVMEDSRDQKKYLTVQIGNQNWMAENLDYRGLAGYCYNNVDSNCTSGGRLYTWQNAAQVCPTGWHLPTQTEVETLKAFADALDDVANNEGAVLKAKSPVWDGNDDLGFNALPSGHRQSGTSGTYGGLGTNSPWWSATGDGSANGIYYGLYSSTLNSGAILRIESYPKTGALLVRCVENSN